ncbi:MAG: hypothetical protein COA47_12970 [Robiginitomaculum sp.]|nr:MAG: hypothetical protein COA47_12970 [Robiginitomaculum sp.]
MAKLTSSEKLDLARTRTNELVDKVIELIETDAVNDGFIFTDRVSKTIPKSHAANAYNVLVRNQLDYQIVRTIALWDNCQSNDFEKISIPAILNLLDADTIELAKKQNLAVEIAKEEDGFYREMADESNDRCDEVIGLARRISASDKLKSLTNFRSKHLAHNLNQTRLEKKASEPLQDVSPEELRELLESAIKCISALHICLNGTHFDFESAKGFATKNARELWDRFKFT